MARDSRVMCQRCNRRPATKRRKVGAAWVLACGECAEESEHESWERMNTTDDGVVER